MVAVRRGAGRVGRSRAAAPDPDPVAAYHDLLFGASADESAQALREGQEARSLVFGHRPLCIALRPQLMSRSRYEAACAAALGVERALSRLEKALLTDAALRAELDLEPEEERLALADPGSKRSSPSIRIDGFFTDELRFVENNAESPAGMAYSDTLTEVFEELPVMRAFRRRFRARALPVARRQTQSMLRAFHEWSRGRSKTPAMAIVDWTGVPTLTEFEMFRDRFEREGIRTVICDPADLEYRRGRLRAAGRHVNLVYRRVLTTELLGRADVSGPLTKAYLDGNVCVVNSFRAKLLHKKMSLALLSDDRYAKLYTKEDRAAIRRHIPWTRKVRDGATTHGGKRVPDLSAFVLSNREHMVLKPNDEYGGKGVVLGWTVDDHEWEQSLHVALSQSYVVQEAVEVPKEPFPVAVDGVEMLDLSLDVDPYVFDGRPSGCLTRLSSSALLNVTAGAGSVVPTYVVEGAK
ncbi:MAG TPA: hypothetical protein VNN79_15305 [Actinomycetota bacterium]|nr:hypothetical protein [Actinomycetota bacterium]